ncbi:hypothetical protein O6P43_003694 [Quillaja saponaria]|uniref:Uncharacterized protein n=1 Tax=Quillaja saponaria TaxID=32244 RepID=A0AAD7QGH8_QUISA|nr:hypothetical protein O6P43_003694 [Quillaja saponaria]
MHFHLVSCSIGYLICALGGWLQKKILCLVEVQCGWSAMQYAHRLPVIFLLLLEAFNFQDTFSPFILKD